MPEVERVADPPDEDKERAREEAPVRDRAGACGDQEDGGARRRERPPAGEDAGCGRAEGSDDEQREPGECGGVSHARRQRPAAAQLGVRQQRAEGELPEAGGQEVERRRGVRVDAGDVPGERRGREQPEHGAGEPPRPARRDQQQWKDEVELLLDGQRPEMRQRPQGRVLAEVAGVLPEDEVRGEGGGRGDVLAECLVRVREEQPAPGSQCRHEHEDQSGEEAQDAAAVEPREREAPLGEPAPDDPRDQVAGDDEEDVDAREAAPHRGREGVEGDDGRDRDGAEAVDVGPVVEPGPRAHDGNIGREPPRP